MRASRAEIHLLILLLLATLVAGLLAAPTAALTFDLIHEFDGVEPDAQYATVVATQNGDDIDFEVTLGGLLGAGEDLHELYFNLDGAFSGLAVTTSNAPNSAYTVSTSPPVAGGAGSSFDFGVSFGNGAGPPGNGVLAFASFTLTADQALSVNDLLVSSFTSGGIEAQLALHIQGTNTAAGSETVGGVVPEPTTALLLLGGLIGLALRGR